MKHNFPFLNPCWPLQITFLSFMSLKTVCRISWSACILFVAFLEDKSDIFPLWTLELSLSHQVIKNSFTVTSASSPSSHGTWTSVWPCLSIMVSDYLPSMVVLTCSRHSTLVSMAWDSWRLVLLEKTKVEKALSTFFCVLTHWGLFLIKQWGQISSVFLFLLLDLRKLFLMSWHAPPGFIPGRLYLS